MKKLIIILWFIAGCNSSELPFSTKNVIDLTQPRNRNTEAYRRAIEQLHFTYAIEQSIKRIK